MRVKKFHVLKQENTNISLIFGCPWPFERTNGPTKRGKKLPKETSTRAGLYCATCHIISVIEVSNL